MHTEHLQNVHPVRVVGGWLVAVAVTSMAVFGFVLLGLMGLDAERDSAWAVAAVVVGFLVGGWFTGFRTLEAPILHGIALGLTSLVAWAVLNLIMVVAFPGLEWEALTPTVTLVVLLTQITAAVTGCWVGTWQARTRADEWSREPEAGTQGPADEL